MTPHKPSRLTKRFREIAREQYFRREKQKEGLWLAASYSSIAIAWKQRLAGGGRNKLELELVTENR